VAADPLLPVADALKRILASVPLMAGEEAPVSMALGRVAAEPVRSRRTQPPVAMSAMDGYAVRAEDVATVPATLTRVGSAPAGGSYDGTLQSGQTVRIFTGGPVPDGADAIVIQEDVDAESETDGARITVREEATAGRYIRPAGLDFKIGDIGIAAGRAITARDTGLAAAMNVPWILVRRRPKVAILATGDEIVRPGEPIGPNQIVSSNSYALSALVRACGGEPVVLGIAPDTIEGIQQLVRGARGMDLVLTTGGASVGEHDLVQKALGTDAYGPGGLDVDFWRIAMRPGKPLIFGKIGGTPMIGLPGNPVSTLVCGVIFVKPAIEAMLGLHREIAPPIRARLGASLTENDQRQDYLRATLTVNDGGERTATPFNRQDSSMLARLAQADCLIVRPPHDLARLSGEWVRILPLSGSLISI
jgi:molybdopterin molybdotransferase